MTRKDFEEIAFMLGNALYYAESVNVARGMVAVFTTNLRDAYPNFNEAKFRQAVVNQATMCGNPLLDDGDWL